MLVARCARIDDVDNGVEVEAPLQLACMRGKEYVEVFTSIQISSPASPQVINKLLSNEADAFLSTLRCAAEGYGYRCAQIICTASQLHCHRRRGSVSALAVAAAYGRRKIVHALLNSGKRVYL